MTERLTVANWVGSSAGWLRIAYLQWNRAAGTFVKYGNRYKLETGGDPQNEAVIASMRLNPLWDLCWQKSERGGKHLLIARVT